jgi:hypothetical protein
MLATALTLAAAAPAAAAHAGPVIIDFAASTTTRDQHAARTVGAFTMTGRLVDTGTVAVAFRFAGPRIDGTATLIGTRGILTIGLHGTSGGVVDNRQSAAGEWGVCGGTSVYKRLRGRGHWDAIADFAAAPAGTMPPTMHGELLGHMYRNSTRSHAVVTAAHDPLS